MAGRRSSAFLREKSEVEAEEEPIMCTMITHQAKIYGRGKKGEEWIEC